MNYLPAPELEVAEWLNGPATTLADLRGRVVMLETFQMLCPGCISRGLPQAQKVHAYADTSDLVVLGLHTVFEHHEVMGRDALEVFISEYRLAFPVGIDRHREGESIPLTMQNYGLRGTPSTVLIDRQGRVRLSSFGGIDDFALGAQIGQLLAEKEPALAEKEPALQTLDMSAAGEFPVCEVDGTC